MKPNVNHVLREMSEDGSLEARSLEEAVDKLSLQSVDSHPEKRMKVFYKFISFLPVEPTYLLFSIILV